MPSAASDFGVFGPLRPPLGAPLVPAPDDLPRVSVVQSRVYAPGPTDPGPDTARPVTRISSSAVTALSQIKGSRELESGFEKRETSHIRAGVRGRIPHLSIPGRPRGRETIAPDAVLPPVVLLDLVADGVKVLA